jgi:hypothetical protein
VCQGAPAAEATFVRHTGMLLAWHQMTYRGRWCRDCGTATFRKAQNWDLMLGWWGLASFFLNIYAILRNLASYNRVRALAPPAGSSQPLQPGRTLVARPGLWVLLIVLVAIVIFIVTRAGH